MTFAIEQKSIQIPWTPESEGIYYPETDTLEKVWSVARDVLLFAPLWLVSHTVSVCVTYLCYGNFLSPAQLEWRFERALNFAQETHVVEKLQVKTPDGAMVSALRLCPKDLVGKDDIPTVIRSCGLGELYEYGGFCEFLDMDAQVVMFDYRGTGSSIGKLTADGVVMDAHAIYRFVVDSLGTSPENITLYGYSFGGGVFASLRRHIDPRVKMILDRSFTSLTETAIAIFGVIGYAVGFFMWLSNWHFNTFESLQKDPSAPTLVMNVKGDEILPREVHLAKHLLDLPQKNLTVMNLTTINPNPHQVGFNRLFTPRNKSVSRIVKELIHQTL